MGSRDDIKIRGSIVDCERCVEGGAEQGTEGARMRLTKRAVPLAMMCPTLFLRMLKKAARLEKTEFSGVVVVVRCFLEATFEHS